MVDMKARTGAQACNLPFLAWSISNISCQASCWNDGAASKMEGKHVHGQEPVPQSQLWTEDYSLPSRRRPVRSSIPK
ncbi:hypothetical protein CRYUN_Cryun15aG0014600 [Craigia yunnanensis]